MPSLANITVKKNDGTTDITYTGLIPAAGDRSGALWRCETVGAAAAFRPTLSLSSRPNGPGTARRLEATYSYPVTVTGTDGITRVVDKAIITTSGVIPLGMASTEVNEAVSQGFNLLVSALIKSCFQAGYSAT
jgi:hypothetical protein